jgi:ubiquinone/menaquinone biosynthesis C-methylase UbiE
MLRERAAARCSRTPAVSRLDNRAYYDDFAGWYENERHLPYHRMLDDLEIELVERYAAGKDVLEVGCGTGLLLHRAAQFARRAAGIDLSGGMLARAHQRGLDVAQASATDLPIATASVDVAYSFKVLAHIPDIRGVLREMARVVRPGGWVIAEFYNARSLRRLIKAIKPPSAVSETTHDEHVFTRYDDAAAIRSYLPAELSWVATRGIRVVTPIARVLEVPVLGPAVRWAEHHLADLPGARSVGGFLVACCQRR